MAFNATLAASLKMGSTFSRNLAEHSRYMLAPIWQQASSPCKREYPQEPYVIGTNGKQQEKLVDGLWIFHAALGKLMVRRATHGEDMGVPGGRELYALLCPILKAEHCTSKPKS